MGVRRTARTRRELREERQNPGAVGEERRCVGRLAAPFQPSRLKDRLTGKRMLDLDVRWLHEPRILHPWPNRRFDARTKGRSPALSTRVVGLCGGRRQWRSLPRSPARCRTRGQQHVRRGERCVGSTMSFGAAQSLRIRQCPASASMARCDNWPAALGSTAPSGHGPRAAARARARASRAGRLDRRRARPDQAAHQRVRQRRARRGGHGGCRRRPRRDPARDHRRLRR